MRKRFLAPVVVPLIALVIVRCADPGLSAPEAPASGATPLKGLVISNSRTPSVGVLAIGRASMSVANVEGVAYVSLAPGSLPGAVEIQIENRTHSSPALVVPAVDGGFDPVRVPAAENDTLALTARMHDGRSDPIMVKVPAKRPPSVVRTNPPRGRTDVALNVVVGVVFTEPLDRATVNASSLQLLRDGKPVPGEVILDEDSWTAKFVPEAALDPGSTYELVVTKQVRDLDGDSLEVSLTSTFVTGTTRCAERFGQRGCLPGTEENRAISGTVIERTAYGPRPVPNATISAWLWVTDTSGYRLNPIQSGADGRYTLTSLPAGKVQLHADVPGLDQPCGVAAQSAQPSANADIELGASPGFTTWHDGPYTVTGVVFEGEGITFPLTPGQRLLYIADVRVVYEAPENFVVATTTSDEGGNFDLCDLPYFGRNTYKRSFISLAKSGFETSRSDIVPGVKAWFGLRRAVDP